jgi:ABC-type phosphate transport system substrate-binding protein
VRSTLVRRALQSAVVGGVLVSSMLSTVLPAHAQEPAGTLAVAATGSDTTENVMNEYLTGKTTSNDGANTYTVHTYNIPAFPSAAGYPVQNDGRCNAVSGAPGYTGDPITWVPTGTAGAPPLAASGSGAGRTLLKNQRSVGASATKVACVDIARSSSKGDNSPTGSEAGFEYYGFALDAVTWATPSLKAPAVLTRQQVKDIYLCNVTDWSAVGGVPGPIQRYLPQSGSGTLNVFLSEFLDSPATFPTNGSCPAVKQLDKNGNPFEENQGNTIDDADIDKAILPYSGGVWAFQKNNSVNPSIDKRNNIRLGGLQTVTGPTVQNVARWNGTNGSYELDYVNGANPSGVVSDQNTTLVNTSFSKVNGFSGVRFLFNVVDTLNLQSYGPAVGLVGFDNAASPTFKSPLCNNAARTTILSYGFAPLTTTGGGSSNAAGSTCRKF